MPSTFAVSVKHMSKTTLTRMRDRAITDRAELDRLLDDTFLAHVGMADGSGGAVVIPTAIARDRLRSAPAAHSRQTGQRSRS